MQTPTDVQHPSGTPGSTPTSVASPSDSPALTMTPTPTSIPDLTPKPTTAVPTPRPTDPGVRPGGDIFNGGKMLGGTVVDYLSKTIWGGYEDWNCLGQLRESGMNWVRVGVLMKNDETLAGLPVDQWNTVPQQGWSTVEYAEAILNEATANGFRKILFFFLSDQAASGAMQPAPHDWKDLSVDETCTRLKEYCFETTRYYTDKGISIDLYEIGNEIERGILEFRPDERIARPVNLDILVDMQWMRDNVWNIEAKLLKAAIAGVRQADPDARIGLHGSCLGRGVDNRLIRGFFQAMKDFGVPYDVAGVSYYWSDIHIGDISLGAPQPAYYQTKEFTDFLDFIVTDLKKKFIFSEYVYPSFKPSGLKYGNDIGYPYTPEGQASWIKDFLRFCSENDKVSGSVYFYPDWYPTFSTNPMYEMLNACGLFGNDMKPGLGLKAFNPYRDP